MTEALVSYEWRGSAEELELDWLQAEAFDHPPTPTSWQRQLEHHSLGWVCARIDEELVGFVNVIWDGGQHAVLLDTMVLPREQRRGIGTEIVRVAAIEARRSGCEWLHVDFDRDMAGFFLERCGFGPSEAGLLDLTGVTVVEEAYAEPYADPEAEQYEMPEAEQYDTSEAEQHYEEEPEAEQFEEYHEQ
jgi:GNAT superfamily N-acetyltransferase